MSTPDDVPTIRPFQFDGGTNGMLKKSVNLYRGQVTIPLPLVTLSGRNGLSVALTIQLANKATPKGERPEGRLSPRHLVYKQTVTSSVSLPAPSKSLNANVARWAGDGGKPARQALTVAFRKIGLLLPRALGLTEADIKTLTEEDEDTIARWAYGDHVQDLAPDNSLVFDGGLENSETLQQ